MFARFAFPSVYTSPSHSLDPGAVREQAGGAAWQRSSHGGHGPPYEANCAADESHACASGNCRGADALTLIAMRGRAFQLHRGLSRPTAALRRSFGRTMSTAPGGDRVAVVQGSSRGIGLGFVRHLLQRPDYKVVATCRDVDSAAALKELQSQHGPDRLRVLGVDVLDEESVSAAAANVAETHGRADLVVSCAGILKDVELKLPETTLRNVTAEGLARTFTTNAFGPILVGKHFTPLLRKSENAKFAAISAKVGSITDNRIGGWYGYRASKAALNMLLKTFAIELSHYKPRVTVLALHPGTTDTALSKPFQKHVPEDKLFSVDFTVERLLSIIDGASYEDSGKFFAWNGEELPY